MTKIEQKIPEGWSVKKLGECFSFLKTPSYSRAETTDIGDVHYIHYGDIHTKYPLHVYPQDIDIYVSDEQAKKGDLLKTGDLILLDASEDYDGTTKCIELIDIKEKDKVISGLHTLALRDNKKTYKDGFRAYLTSIPFVKNNFWKQVTGIKVYGVSKDNLKKLQLLVPPLPEQEKIAGILGTWDEAIEKLSSLIEQKKNLKKGLMQRLLTGKTRLNGFIQPWKEVKLGEITEFKKGKQLNKLDMIDEGLYPVLNGGISYSGYTNNWNTEKNTITISEGGNSCGYVSYIQERFWSGGHCYTLDKIKVDKIYLYQLLKFEENNLMKLRVGSGLPNIQLSSLNKFKVNIPIDTNEQQAIADVLSTADEEINLLNKKLEALKEQKKGLMQQLLTGQTRVKVN